MARQSETRTLLRELIDLEEEVLRRLLASAGEAGDERITRAVEGIQTLRALTEPKVAPEMLAEATRACDRLRAALMGEVAKAGPGPSEPSQSPVSIDVVLNDVALRAVRSEPDDRSAMTELLDLLPAGLEAEIGSEAGRDLFRSLRGLLTDLAAGKGESPQSLFEAAAMQMDRLSVLVADEARTAAAGGPAPKPPPESAKALASAPLQVSAPAHETAANPVPSPMPVVASGAGAESAAGGWTLTEDTDASLVADFVTECSEYTQGAEASLLSLEGNPDDVEAINTVFRAFHTIKGTSGFLGIELLSELAHKAENLLSRMRDKKIRCTGGYADLALRANDGVRSLIESVRGVLTGGALAKPSGYDRLIELLENPEAHGINDEAGAGAAAGADADAASEPADGDEAGAEPVDASDLIGVAENGPADRATPGVMRAVQAMQGTKTTRVGADGSDSSVRVRTDRLDRLIDMVGELVIAHSMVSEDGDLAAGRNADLVRKVAHSGKIVRELQDLSMSMRMVPLKPTFLKMSRLVRDLTHKNDRQVSFQTSGEDTEIDRNMVDVLADPLIHMIRNACDHGVEPPDEREAAGKGRAGRVMLSAYHAGGNVVVELQDDGRGLNREKIAKKAIERGLIESDKGMSDSDVYGLIFEAGFSTAEKVTEVSGRGVGMDVVRRAVQSLRGRIEIQSELGRGTTFAIKLPLTLAVTDGMLIRVGAQRFILPTASIQMSFRPEETAVKSVLGRGELVLLRGELIPVVRLHQLFGIPGANETPTNALLVIIADGERRSAVLVDEILGQQQVVAKSLGEGSGKVAGVAGGAILGDGRVGLILDPAGLIGLARGGSNWEHRTLVEAIG